MLIFNFCFLVYFCSKKLKDKPSSSKSVEGEENGSDHRLKKDKSLTVEKSNEREKVRGEDNNNREQKIGSREKVDNNKDDKVRNETGEKSRDDNRLKKGSSEESKSEKQPVAPLKVDKEQAKSPKKDGKGEKVRSKESKDRSKEVKKVKKLAKVEAVLTEADADDADGCDDAHVPDGYRRTDEGNSRRAGTDGEGSSRRAGVDGDGSSRRTGMDGDGRGSSNDHLEWNDADDRTHRRRSADPPPRTQSDERGNYKLLSEKLQF